MSKVVTTMYDFIRFKNAHCDTGCGTCPLQRSNNGYDIYCATFIREHCDLAEKIVSNWCEEHPIRTRLTEFLKMFPDAQLDSYGFPISCVNRYHNICCTANNNNCNICKTKYWNQEIKD